MVLGRTIWGNMQLNFFPMAVWWPALDSIETWVNQRGVNVLVWQNAIHSMPGDWDKAHQKVEALRQKGVNVWVIRQPAYKLVPDKLDITFDQKWKSHLLAFCLDDEFEDKQPNGNLWSNPQPIYDYVTATVKAYKTWMPDVPVFANFNGSHVGDGIKDRYVNMVNAGIDILCSDLYPCAAQQVDDKGKLLWSDVVQGMVGATKSLAAWFPGKPVWTFLECCNQDIAKAGTPGWSSPWKFVGSRAPTSDELWQATYFVGQYGGNGIAWFPQAHFGGVIDATAAALVPTMVSIAQHQQTLVKPPAPTPTPPAKKLLAVVRVYDDGSVVTGTQ